MTPARILALIAPALIPSWRFFDRIGPAPIPRYATASAPDKWHPLAPRRACRRAAEALTSLIHNPARNKALYITSLAERLVTSDCPHAHSALIAFAHEAAPGETLTLWVSIRTTGQPEEEVFRSGPHAP